PRHPVSPLFPYTTLFRSLPTEGTLKLAGHELDIRSQASWKPHRKDFQIVFQDPYTSLNPRHTVFEILAEPMRVHGMCSSRDLPRSEEHTSELQSRENLVC